MKCNKGIRLGRLINMIPGQQKVIVMDYMTDLVQERGNANEIVHRLGYMMETRNAEVYGVSVVDNAICIKIL